MSISFRPASPADRSSILDLAARSLGWSADSRHAALYEWKHDQNPYGASPTWVAVDGSRIVGLRCFMRWEFVRDGEVVPAVRAVDTATDPDYRGRGVFRKLTMTAVDALRADGVAFVFNTPNAQSLPGYVKMGWVVLGRAPVQIRPGSLTAVPRIVRARVPADVWAQAAPEGALPSLHPAEAEPSARGPAVLSTHRTERSLRWRYGNPLLGYRAATAEGTTVVYRVRRRGPATEAVLCDVIGSQRHGSRALATAARRSGADYALWAGPSAVRAGFVPLPRMGPVVTWRALADTAQPRLDAFDFRLGDLELF